MINYFTVKVKYTKQLENGTFKRVTEPYLLTAMTFGDAENRIYEELGEMIRGEFQVVAITRTELHDVFSKEDADTWYDAKIVFEGNDEGKSKKVRQSFLIAATSVKEANDNLKEELSCLMVDFEITHVSKSLIVDIFPYREELDKEISRTPAE